MASNPDPAGTAVAEAPGPDEAPAARRGFLLHCPHCGAPEALRVDLHDTRRLYCTECEAEVTESDVRALIGLWKRALRWLASAPEVVPAEAE